MRILVWLNNPDDACAFYRSIGPWSQIAAENRDIQVTYRDRPHWAEIREHDVLFIQRPCDNVQVDAMNEAKHLGVPVWVDFDDDLTIIPVSNPTYLIYETRQTAIDQMVKGADLVSTSTQFLSDRMKSIGAKKTVVIPNAMDETLIPLRVLPGDRNKVILWRGTATHNSDMTGVLPEFTDVLEEFSDYTFVCLGCNPVAERYRKKIKNFFCSVRPLKPSMFYRAMIGLKPEVLICPLDDTQFNRSKSNIAALEGSLAGAACLVPHWDEWRIPGVSNYETPLEFAQYLRFLLTEKEEVAQRSEQTWKYIISELPLHKMNNRRVNIARELANA